MDKNSDSFRLHRAYKENSLRRVFLFSLALIIILPAIPLALATNMIYRQEVQRVELQLQETNHQIAQLAARSLSGLLRNLAEAASESEIDSKNLISLPIQYWLGVDKNGLITHSTIRDLPAGQSLPESLRVPWKRIESWSDAGFEVSDMTKLPFMPQAVIFMRVFMPDQSVRILSLDPLHLHQFLTSKFDSFVNRHVYAVDPAGRPIFYSNIQLMSRDSVLSKNPPVKAFIEAKSGPVRYVSVVSGAQRVGYVLPMKETGWGMIVSADIGGRLLELRQRMSWLLVHFIISCVFAALVVVYFSRRVVDPLIAMTKRIREARGFEKEPFRLEGIKGGLLELNLLVREFNEHNKKIWEAEQEAIQTEKIATLGELTAGLAHEIGTPLNVMRGNAQYLMRKLPEDSPDREILGKIITQTGRIADLIRNMLDVARTDTASPVSVDINRVLEKCVNMAREIHPGVKFHVTLNRDLPKPAGYPRRLEHAFLNIIFNGCQAVSDDGNLWIKSSRKDGGECVVVSIEDDGCGIAPEDLPRIMQPFFSTKGSGKGTGLGLALVDRVVREHKGSIRASSKVNVGTYFELTLPTDERNEDIP